MKYTVLFDTETTGLLAPEANDLDAQPYITEICCVKIDDEYNLVEEIDTFVKPPIPISAEITRITNITDKDVAKAPAFEELYPRLAEFFTGVTRLVGHNLPFDRGMLRVELQRIEREFQFPWPYDQVDAVDASMPIEQRRLPLAKLHELATGKPHVGAHRAKADVYALVRCYHWLSEKKMI